MPSAKVTIRTDNQVALGSTTERVALAAWAEDLDVNVLGESGRQIILRLAATHRTDTLVTMIEIFAAVPQHPGPSAPGPASR